jgi:hypothetical protein
MAVLVEAISVIVRRDRISLKYAGGWTAFVNDVPNASLCLDESIARVGFMDGQDVDAFIRHLERRGLHFMGQDRALDFTVVDQQRGIMRDCDWLEFAKIDYCDKGKIAVCWFFNGPRMGYGLHMKGRTMEIAMPDGWQYDGSLSQQCTFLNDDQMAQRLEYLRSEDKVDVYLDTETGKEVYLGRSQ